MSQLWQMSAASLVAAVRAREVSALEVADAHIERALTWNDLGAFLHLEPEMARRRARAIDDRLARGEDPGPLTGVPVALKDNLCTRDMPTTCGSRILETFVPPYDAHVVERLRQAGAVLLGKTNLDEFSMGSSTENSAFRLARNPHRLECTPGGSSGGSAAAVAAGLAPLALGSDTSTARAPWSTRSDFARSTAAATSGASPSPKNSRGRPRRRPSIEPLARSGGTARHDEVASRGSCPATASRSNAASSTPRASGPIWSSDDAKAIRP